MKCDAGALCIEDCTAPCEGRECGTHCGMSCGTCNGDNASCEQGICGCEPQCDGTRCDDGCGGSCACAEGKVCDVSGTCVPDCTNTCAAEGWQCDSLCGVECGPCNAHEECTNHVCVCKPVCDGSSCEDGCGGTCACAQGTQCNASGMCDEVCTDTCKSSESVCGKVCGEDCGQCEAGKVCAHGKCISGILGLTLSQKTTVGKVTRVTLSVDFTPAPADPKPRMADLRLENSASTQCQVENVTPGSGMNGKELFLDPFTLKPWRLRPDGSIQLLIHSAVNSAEFTSGRLLGVVYTCELDATTKQIDFSLARRTHVFAPFEADHLLQQSTYDEVLVVKP